MADKKKAGKAMEPKPFKKGGLAKKTGHKDYRNGGIFY